MIYKIIENNKKYLCLGKFRIKYGHISKIQKLQKHIDEVLKLNFANIANIQFMQSITLPAFHVHQKVFPKYKGINKGKDVVLMGAGTTLNQYQPIKNAIHIGTNRTFKCDKVLLDYLFLQDRLKTDEEQAAINKYQGNNCKKFYGMHYLVRPISVTDTEEANAENFYFIDREVPVNGLQNFHSDISLRPLNTWSSIIFPAFEFALWTHPKRIFLVGCDCSQTGHFDKVENVLSLDRIIEGWKYMKEYVQNYYPDVEVISINPIGLKGLFKDIEQ